MIDMWNMCCMKYMASVPDNYFDLAIVDPPYGIERFKKGLRKGDRLSGNNAEGKFWNNNIPTKTYFDDLFRISKNQIIWGANNFSLPPTEYFIIWDKQQTVDNFASAEYAWTNCKMPAKIFHYGIHEHNHNKSRIHPTEKPVKLYKWLLEKYAKPGYKIFDSHLGSASSAIAAHQMGFDFVGVELDKDYFEASQKRFKEETAQRSMF